jgi:hypothetical protein
MKKRVVRRGKNVGVEGVKICVRKLAANTGDFPVTN